MADLLGPLVEDGAHVAAATDLSSLDGATLLLTGASGLVGVNLLASLVAARRRGVRPARVVAVMQREPAPHLAECLRLLGGEVMRGDLSDSTFCRDLPPADFVIHAAGYGQPGRFLEAPLKTILLNTTATAALLGRVAPGGGFLFVSTSELYSGCPAGPTREDQIGTTGPDHPRAAYIEGKRCGEALCHAARAAGVPARIGRLALAYGPGTLPGDRRVLNAFIERALQGRLTLQDHGAARRTYCYVADAVTMLWRILLDGREAVYNVGGTSGTTIADLARAIARHVGVPIEWPPGEAAGLAGAPDEVQHLPSFFNIFIPPFPLEPAANLIFGLGALYHI